MFVVPALNPPRSKCFLPLLPCVSRILAGSFQVRQPRIHLSDDIGIEGRSALLHGRTKTLLAPIPKDSLNGFFQLCSTSSSFGSCGFPEPALCARNVSERGIHFNVVHQQ